MKAGAFDYLVKPVEIEQLVAKIRQAFDKLVRQQEQARKPASGRAWSSS
jgi:FixJ family two-component response regulator